MLLGGSIIPGPVIFSADLNESEGTEMIDELLTVAKDNGDFITVSQVDLLRKIGNNELSLTDLIRLPNSSDWMSLGDFVTINGLEIPEAAPPQTVNTIVVDVVQEPPQALSITRTVEEIIPTRRWPLAISPVGISFMVIVGLVLIFLIQWRRHDAKATEESLRTLQSLINEEREYKKTLNEILPERQEFTERSERRLNESMPMTPIQVGRGIQTEIMPPVSTVPRTPLRSTWSKNSQMGPNRRRFVPRELPKTGVSMHASVGKGHWVKEVIDDGAMILLEDSSLWEISALERTETMLWLALDDITVIESDDPVYPYKLINGREVVNAKRVEH